jgi:D-alanyl-D-alanine dipeptidase
VYLTDVIPDAILEIRYYSTYNFVGKRVDDYLAPLAIITRDAANALKTANDDLRKQGYAIKIFDTYRPQGAVDHFMRWGKDPKDILTKEYFYPDLDKATQVDPNVSDTYIASRSGHTRGSTVDLTLVNMKTGMEVDMGSPFDFFGPISGHGYEKITDTQKANRLILKNVMLKVGFNEYDDEWWHYTLKNAPFPSTYFKFPVMRSAVTSWPKPPIISNSSLQKGTAGTSYSQTLDTNGTAPISWSIESGKLPDGLKINSSGVISGTPTTEGTFSFTIMTTNVLADHMKALSITIDPRSGSGGCNIAGLISILALFIGAKVVFAKKRL